MKRAALLIAGLIAGVVAAFAAYELRPKKQILRFGGLDPVRIGMTLPEAETALGTRLKSVYPDPMETCWFGNRADGVDGTISYWFENGKIVRIDIDDHAWPSSERIVPPVATERYIQVGSTPDEIKRAYGAQLNIDFHPQGNAGDENYLYMTVLSGDKQYGLAFEIWEGKVKNFQAGTAEAFYIDEPCI
jgi:hypothetical protein